MNKLTYSVACAASLLSCMAIATAASSLSAQAQTSESLPPLSTNVSFPGTALTTAEALMARPQTSYSQQTSSENISENNAVLAQRRRSTQTDRTLADTYLGIGADIGLGGDTALGESGFATVGKLGFTDNLSLRTASSIGDGVVLMLSVAYDFPIDREPFEPVVLAPFIGGGVAFELDEGNSGPMISGGVDYPVSKELTATARINVAFIQEETTDVGIILGIAYNFPALINR
ncbi:MAG: hypothetical protein AB4352_25165 [Hormoscilla sp.]